jgi:hypothetical protein
MFPIKFPLFSAALCSLSNKVENSAIKCYFIAPFLAKNGAVMRI